MTTGIVAKLRSPERHIPSPKLIIYHLPRQATVAFPAPRIRSAPVDRQRTKPISTQVSEPAEQPRHRASYAGSAAGSPAHDEMEPRRRAMGRAHSCGDATRGEREPGGNPGLSRSGMQERPPSPRTEFTEPEGSATWEATASRSAIRRAPAQAGTTRPVPASPKTCQPCRVRRTRRPPPRGFGRADHQRGRVGLPQPGTSPACHWFSGYP